MNSRFSLVDSSVEAEYNIVPFETNFGFDDSSKITDDDMLEVGGHETETVNDEPITMQDTPPNSSTIGNQEEDEDESMKKPFSEDKDGDEIVVVPHENDGSSEDNASDDIVVVPHENDRPSEDNASDDIVFVPHENDRQSEDNASDDIVVVPHEIGRPSEDNASDDIDVVSQENKRPSEDNASDEMDAVPHEIVRPIEDNTSYDIDVVSQENKRPSEDNGSDDIVVVPHENDRPSEDKIVSDDASFNLRLEHKGEEGSTACFQFNCRKKRKRKYIIVRPGLTPAPDTSIIQTESNASLTRKELGYLCLACGVIVSKGETTRHHKAAHKSGLKCSYCPQVFFTKHVRDLHQQFHRGGDSRHVDDFCQCKICGGSFISLLYLELHIYECHGEDILKNPKIIHLGPSSFDEADSKEEPSDSVKRYRCGICNALFVYYLNLDCHVMFHDEAIYSCGLCNSSFSLLDSLIVHVRIHDDKHTNSLYDTYISNTSKVLVNNKNSHPEQMQTNLGLENSDKNDNCNASQNLRRNEDFDVNLQDQINDKFFQELTDCEQTPQELRVGEESNPISSVPSQEIQNIKIECYNTKLITTTKTHLNCSSVEHSLSTSGSHLDTSSLITNSRTEEDISLHNNEPFINPYLFHFLPGGKCSIVEEGNEIPH